MVIEQGEDGLPHMLPFERFGWRGCWRCEHCLAVCPAGALSIFGKNPEDSLPPAPPETGEYLEQVVANRRSCRRYRDENVDPAIINRIMAAMQNVPAGGNAQSTEYTVVDDKDRMRQIRDVAYAAMEEAAAHKRYTSSFDDFYYAKMKQSEATVRKGDLLFCGAPHLFVAHVKATGRWAADYAINCNLATAYFELLANAHGLGTVIMSYPSDVLCELAPEAREKKRRDEKVGTSLAIGMCLGMSIGMAIGTALGNTATGMCIGMSVGMCFGLALSSAGSSKKSDK